MEAPSEKVQAKAATYLLSGQVKVVHVTGTPAEDEYGVPEDFVRAEVTPSDGGDPYYVRLNSVGWHCDCPARVQVCAHILAVQTCTLVRKKPVAESVMSMEDIDALLSGP